MFRGIEGELKGRYLSAGKEQDLGGFEWRWQAFVSPTADQDLRRLDVEVRFHKDDVNSIAIVTAFLGRPR
ncbi:hypothetical protein CCP3SC15_7070002 [Gammaproteobacteria bacterium]